MGVMVGDEEKKTIEDGKKPREKYMKIGDVCEYTSFGKSFIYKHSSDEVDLSIRIPCYLFGVHGEKRWKLSEVERWMQKFKVKAS